MTAKIVKEFKIKNRRCFVVSLDHLMPYTPIFHNGYVESTFKRDYDDYPYEFTEEQTFSGVLMDKDNLPWCIGFDTVHYNDNPSTQSAEIVEERLKIFAKELIKFEQKQWKWYLKKWLNIIKNIFQKKEEASRSESR